MCVKSTIFAAFLNLGLSFMRQCFIRHTFVGLFCLILVLSGFANQPNKSTIQRQKISLLINRANKLVHVATNHDTVSSLLNQAEKLIKMPEDTHQAINILLVKGLNEFYNSNYEQAAEMYYDALGQAEQSKDSILIAKADEYLGRIFDEMEDYDEAIVYFQKSLKICQSINDTAFLAKTFQNIAISYQNKKDLEKAIEFDKKADQLARLRKDTLMIIDITNNFGTIAYAQKNPDKALSFYQEAFALYQKTKNEQGIAMAYNNIGLVYLDKKEYPKSLEYFEKSLKLATHLKMYDFIGDIYSNLTIYYAEIKDYKNAYHFYDQYNIVYDSLAGEKKSKMIRQVQAKYQLYKTHRDMEDLKQKNQVQLQSINNAKSVQIYLTAITLIVILLMITTIYLLFKEKKLARMLKTKTDELRELNVSKDKFFSIIAHDLSNPFSILVSYTNLLKTDFESFSTAELQQVIVDLNNASENGYNLLQNLLLWTRSQTNRIHIYKTSLNFFDLFEQVKAVVEYNLISKNQKLIAEIDPALTVFADKDMVSTVMRNLIFNAIKFSKNDSDIKLKASVAGLDLQIDVIDTGIGISPESLKKLFRLDNNCSTTGTNGETGTGLGLVICREFIEQNGGKIWAESQLGKGSVFSFTIPMNAD